MMMSLIREQVFDTVKDYTKDDTLVLSIVKNWVNKFNDLNILGIKVKRLVFR